MFTIKFLKSIAEWTIGAFAAAYVSAVVVLPDAAIIDVEALKVAVGAGILAFLKGLAAGAAEPDPVLGTRSASFVK